MTSDTSGDSEVWHHRRWGDGLARLPDDVLSAVVQAVRLESDGMRAAIHRLRRVRWCDRSIHVGGGRFVVAGECLCCDLLLEMVAEADCFLRTRPPDLLHNLPGAVRVHVRKRMTDWTRRRRVEMGAPARPERLRSGTMAAHLPDAYHVALLHYLAEEAGSLAPLGGDDGALPRRLATLLATEFGGSVADHLPRVVRGVAVVEAVCRQWKVCPFPGARWRVTWWERYIEGPLGRRARFDDVPLHALLHDLPDRPADQASGDPGGVVATVLRVVAGVAEVDAETMQAAAAELVRTRQLSSVAAERFVTDPGRLRIAAEQVRVLLAA